ncbi:MAG: Uma2 family endonuclease [Chloroflexota bacterium]|nr:Uma2 family endonuclease [Chloroflexota bacterium]MDE2961340.1 Uma2 family endonuclease [Chloroflexota bacterium]
MVTVEPEPTSTAPPDDPEPAADWVLAGELRLNLSALGVDHLAPDFGERLCQLSTDNPPWQFEYSAAGELIIVPPPGSESSREEADAIGELYIWRRLNGGMSYPSSVGFHLPSGAQRIPDAAWITQERYDNLTPAEHRGTINGAPDFVVEIRSRSDRLPPFLAKMQEWMDGGATLGWGIDSRQRRAYIYRAGVAEPEILDNPESLSGEDLLPGFIFEVRRLIFDRMIQEEPR